MDHFDVSDQRMIYYDLSDPESVHNAVGKVRSTVRWLDESGAIERRRAFARVGESAIGNTRDRSGAA